MVPAGAKLAEADGEYVVEFHRAQVGFQGPGVKPAEVIEVGEQAVEPGAAPGAPF